VSDPDLTLIVTGEPLVDELETISQGLTVFNEADVGPAYRSPLAVVVRDGDDSVVAGASGYTAWDWLYIQWLWVDERFRGQHLAARMLNAAEIEARARGCHNAWIDTFSPVALRVYERQGYMAFGALPDFPPGRTRTFLKKSLAGA
jgi:GNAT superfamily N-acetyltransferase